MRRLFALIGFTNLGTLAAAVYFGSTVSLVLCNGCLLAFGVLLFLHKRFDIRMPALVLLSAAFAFGSFSVYAASHVEPMSVLDGQKVTITGRLCELPYEQYNKHYYVLEVSSIAPAEEASEHALPKPDKIRISTQNPLRLDLYDEITGSVQLYSPSGDDGFSSKSYYAAKGITMFGFLYEYDAYTITRTEGKPLYYYALRVRQAMLASIQNILPEQEGGLLGAAVLGEKQTLDPTVRDAFLANGIYHVLVVSGLHMSIISMLLLNVFQAAHLPRQAAVCLTAAAVVCFMAVTGFSPSVMRSGIMVLILLGGMLLHRKADAINSLGIAVFLICFGNPYAAADLGLLLSFGSTLGILVLTPRLKTAFSSVFVKGYWQRPVLHRLASYLTETLSVTLGVLIFTLPIFILSGREISLIAPLSNLLFLLPATVMIQAGFLAAVFHLIPAFLFVAKPLALVAGVIGKFLILGTKYLARIPFATVSPTAGFVTLWLVFSLVILAYLLLFFHKVSGYVIGALLSLLLLFTGIFSSNLLQREQIRVGVLDVGEGIAIVISKHGQAAVIGCEGYNSNAIPSYLQMEGIHAVTYLQLTSGENQEKKNGAAILNAYPTEQVLLHKTTYSGGALEKSLAKADKVSYYQDSAEVTLLDDVIIRMDGNYSEHGIWISVYDVTFFVVSEGYIPDRLSKDKNAADFLIADGLPNPRWAVLI